MSDQKYVICTNSKSGLKSKIYPCGDDGLCPACGEFHETFTEKDMNSIDNTNKN